MPTLEQVREGETVTLKDGSEAQVLLVDRRWPEVEVVLGDPNGGPQRRVVGERDDDISKLKVEEVNE